MPERTRFSADRCSWSVALATGLAAATLVAAQSSSPQQRPAFRAGAHYVRVDAYPFQDGRIVRGLTAGDFEVLEDGRPERIETLEFIEFPSWPVDAERRDPNSVRDGFRLAADPAYRVFVFYYDVHHVDFVEARRLRTPFLNMVQRMLGPRDLFGVLTPRQRPDELTLGQRTYSIERQIDSILEANSVGAHLFEPADQQLLSCLPLLSEEEQLGVAAVRRLEKVYLDLRALVARLGALRDERTNLVVFSTGLIGPPLDAALLVKRDSGPPAIGVGSTGRLGTNPARSPLTPGHEWCDAELGRLAQFDHRQQRRDLVVEARQANVAIYTVSPAGLGGAEDRGYDLMADHTASLLELSEPTDAIAVVATNDLDAGLRRIVDDLEAYYVLGYYTSNTDWNGGMRRISVRLKSTGDRIRARREYRAPTAAGMARASAAASAGREEPFPSDVMLEQALGSLSRLSARAPLALRAVPVGGDLLVAVELGAAYAAGAPASGFDVQVEATGSAGQTTTAEGRIEPGLRGALVPLAAVGAGPWSVSVTVAAGRETLRDRFDIAPPGSGMLGAPVVYRAMPGPRSPLWPAAELAFRRTERVHLEWRLDAAPDAIEARLLNAAGDPLGIPVTVTQRSDRGGVMLMADVNLAPAAAADYVIEVRATIGGRQARSLTGIRVQR